MIGTSRKSFLGEITGAMVDERLGGTLYTNMYALDQGASFLRVHDVFAIKNAMLVRDALRRE